MVKLVSTIKIDACQFFSEKSSSHSFRAEKPLFGYTVENELFEFGVYSSCLTLLTNKLVNIDKIQGQNNGKVIAFGYINNGSFLDIVKAKTQFIKLLHIDSEIFRSFVRSAQAFSKSIAIKKIDYSTSFSLLVFAIENLANITYNSIRSKRARTIKFALNNVVSDRFLTKEIRQLQFTGNIQNIDLFFKKLIHRSYILRCDYVHDAKIIPIPSLLSDQLSMAFISNDQKTLFPSHFWLRRIINLALVHFLNNQLSTSENHITDYSKEYQIGTFKSKKAIKKNTFVGETDIYLQQLSDDYVKSEYLNQ